MAAGLREREASSSPSGKEGEGSDSIQNPLKKLVKAMSSGPKPNAYSSNNQGEEEAGNGHKRGLRDLGDLPPGSKVEVNGASYKVEEVPGGEREGLAARRRSDPCASIVHLVFDELGTREARGQEAIEELCQRWGRHKLTRESAIEEGKRAYNRLVGDATPASAASSPSLPPSAAADERELLAKIRVAREVGRAMEQIREDGSKGLPVHTGEADDESSHGFNRNQAARLAYRINSRTGKPEAAGWLQNFVPPSSSGGR